MIKVLISAYLIALLCLALQLGTNAGYRIDHDTPSQDIEFLKMFRKPKPNPNNATNYTIALRKENNEFYGTVRLGSTGQPFNVILDTSWTATWFMSKECSPGIVPGCSGEHNLYDHVRSASYVRNDTKFLIGAGDNRFEGYYSIDKINYGATRVPSQLFVEMTFVPEAFATSKADGILALGPPVAGVQTLPQILYETKYMPNPIFSIYLNDKPESSRGGDVMLGQINGKHIHVDPKTKQKDNITYVQADTSLGRWSFKLDSVMLDLGNVSMPICVHNCKAYVDTGTYDIFASTEEVAAINKILRPVSKVNNRYGVDCSLVHKYPPVYFIIGDKNFTLHGKQYVQKESSGNTLKCYSSFRDYGDSSSPWRLGAAFLARFFSVYNFEKKIVGFVMAA